MGMSGRGSSVWMALVSTCASSAAFADDAEQRLYALTLRADALQAEIDEIAAKVESLREGVIQQRFAATHVRIQYADGLDGQLLLSGARFTFDGVEIMAREWSPGKAPTRFDVLSGEMAPGRRRLEVRFEVVGSGDGLFSYTQELRFEFGSALGFEVPEGKATEIIVIPFLSTDLTLGLEGRLAIKFERAPPNFGEMHKKGEPFERSSETSESH
ncbi:MAG: hypothetical protein HY791_08585 [Deltaproteobacteria bacterium]|nr:hypothetical protein [Deltaproteobacteria bacterium]